MKKSIKVLTYNVSHCVDHSDAKNEGWIFDYSKNEEEKTARVLKKINADIVGINEIFRCNGKPFYDQPQILADKAGYKYSCFGKAWYFETVGDYGNALLSKYRIISMENIVVKLPADDTIEYKAIEYKEDRAFIHAVIDAGVPVSVYATHFGLTEIEQRNMVNALIDKIKNDGLPKILIGDFNTEPDSKVLKPLFDVLTSAADFFNNTQKTFSTFDPYLRIDYIFVSSEFEIEEYGVDDSCISDHFPCYAVVKLK